MNKKREASLTEIREIDPQAAKKEQKRGWERPPSPSSFFEQAFEILPSGNPQGLTIDTPQQTQAKATHAMPVFGFRE
jgi:hypothetical protein